MGKRETIRRWLTVVSFILFMSAGFVTVSVIASLTAKAQSQAQSQCCCSVCIPINQVGTAITQNYSSTIVPALAQSLATISAYFAAAVASYIDAVLDKIDDVTDAIVGWIDTFWYYSLQPSLQAMADQLTAMSADQAAAIGGFLDAAELNRVLMDFKDRQITSHREQRMDARLCEGAVVVSGLTHTAAFRRAYNAAAPAEMLPRSANAAGTAAATGTAADIDARWKNYTARYCQKAYNNGASGCAADSPFVNQDIDVTGTVFLKDTIDVTNNDVKKSVDDLIINIAEPFAKNVIPPGAVNSATGQESVLDGESFKARRQTIYDALYHIVSRRIPGSGSDMATLISPVRAAAGISSVSNNPSHNEVMQALTQEKFRSGKYALSEIDEPENNQRELVLQQVLQMIQMNDQLDLMDRYALLLAAQVGEEVNSMKSAGSAADEAPVK